MAILMVTAMAGAIVGTVALVVYLWRTSIRTQAQRAGYTSVGAYLRAAPRSDEEKRDAVDLALTGLVVCFLGLLFPPLILIGLFPLFYGTRKLAYASMGLGLVDDADQPTE